MRARHREAKRYLGLQPDALDIAAAADVCGFQVRELNPGYVQLRCGLNFWSWGENIELSLSIVDDGLLVDVRSESRMRTQFEDWGKNAKNVRRLFDALEDQLHNIVVTERVPFCASCGYLLAGIEPSQCPECGSKTLDSQLKPQSFGQKLRYAAALAVTLTAAEIVLAFCLSQLGILPGILAMFTGAGGIRLFIINSLGSLVVLLVAAAWKPNR